MRRDDREFIDDVRQRLYRYSAQRGPLVGLGSTANEDAFLLQLAESMRRVKFIEVVCSRDISPFRLDPHSGLFDPIRAASLYAREGREHDEACWLVFLSTLIGKHLHAGWSTTAQIYGALGDMEIWNYQRVSDDPERFRRWLEEHQHHIDRKVGNHRKYLSLSGTKPHAVGAAVESYVDWVGEWGRHSDLFDHALEVANGDGKIAFEVLFESMEAVDTFGRTGRFDYLAMIGKIGLAPLTPNSPHLVGATGPLTGAHLLFEGTKGGKLSASELNRRLAEFGDALGVRMDVLEDAVCNWQKSPGNFIPFRG